MGTHDFGSTFVRPPTVDTKSETKLGTLYVIAVSTKREPTEETSQIEVGSVGILTIYGGKDVSVQLFIRNRDVTFSLKITVTA